MVIVTESSLQAMPLPFTEAAASGSAAVVRFDVTTAGKGVQIMGALVSYADAPTAGTMTVDVDGTPYVVDVTAAGPAPIDLSAPYGSGRVGGFRLKATGTLVSITVTLADGAQAKNLIVYASAF